MALLAFIKFLPHDEEGKTVIHARSPKGAPTTLLVDHPYEKCQQALWNYNQGAKIQNAFPFLTPDERNFMQTGMTAEEYDLMCQRWEDEDEADDEEAF